MLHYNAFRGASMRSVYGVPRASRDTGLARWGAESGGAFLN